MTPYEKHDLSTVQCGGTVFVTAISWARRAVASSALFLAVCFALFTPSAFAQCDGQNGAIADYDSPVHHRLDTQLQNIAGNYCGESNGAQQLEFGPTIDNLPCNISITRDGVFSFEVGGIKKSWTQSMIMLPGTGDHGIKDYTLWGGTTGIWAVFHVQDNRLVKVQTVFDSPTNPDTSDVLSCAFRFVSHAAGSPERKHFASGKSLPLASVGSFDGLDNNGSDSCKLSVGPTGQVNLSFTSSEGTVSSSGELRGRFHDSILNGFVTTTSSNADSWKDPREVIYGPGISLSSNGNPLLGSASINGAEYQCRVGDGTMDLLACSGVACYPETKGIGEAACMASVGNPINVVTGNKFQKEADFVGFGSVNLEFIRYYNSNSSAAIAAMGSNWRTNFDWTLRVDSDKTAAKIYQPDGQVVRFDKIGSAWSARTDKAFSIRPAAPSDSAEAAWIVVNHNGETISFDSQGYLKDLTDANGQTITVTRDELLRLSKVGDQFGHALIFTYDDQSRIRTMKDPLGGLYTYRYTSNMLTHVERPHANGSVVREDKYENARFPDALTGIVDVNGVRFATYAYDDYGRAYSTEHAGGVGKYTIEFGHDESVVTDPTGSSRTYRLDNFNKGRRIVGLDQPAGAGCTAAFSSASFDDDGNVKSETDFKGVVTTYQYEKQRRLVTSMTEAFGGPEQRATTTKWHPSYRIPQRIAEPKRLTTFDYFTDGKLKTKSIQATKDETGAQGFSATPLGSISTWTYAYTTKGQVETVTGPRLGGIDKTTYTYDLLTGDLQSVKNAGGHLTTFADYDANGRVRLITDPNHMTTRMTYTARGLPESRTVSDGIRVRTTTFSYDNVGQLKRITMPDSSYMSYTYDDAHRLTDVTDSAGNTVHYVLNNMGSREKEELRDASGTLKRRVAREFDSLNRVKSETGGAL